MTTILVVDDAAFMRMRMSKILSEAGYEVIQAENGLEAIEKYRASKPDAVLMDITMPEMDGLAALKEIKAIDPAARVAMVTALGQQQIVLEAVKSGAKDFLVKPAEPDRVLAAVTKLCA
ncbi:MAG: response regulator [Dehalococcoidia bacterium]|nr:MAG: response regulator [bacterium]MCE7927807.1 response regulator [Chloroflexi bacterium CFX7]MCL4230302.1 response regulator [Dehalococcoidia bacterium]NUQ56840.1 response regulator [Dehalococcoidia bacterium]